MICGNGRRGCCERAVDPDEDEDEKPPVGLHCQEESTCHRKREHHLPLHRSEGDRARVDAGVCVSLGDKRCVGGVYGLHPVYDSDAVGGGEGADVSRHKLLGGCAIRPHQRAHRNSRLHRAGGDGERGKPQRHCARSGEGGCQEQRALEGDESRHEGAKSGAGREAGQRRLPFVEVSGPGRPEGGCRPGFTRIHFRLRVRQRGCNSSSNRMQGFPIATPNDRTVRTNRLQIFAKQSLPAPRKFCSPSPCQAAPSVVATAPFLRVWGTYPQSTWENTKFTPPG